MYFVNCHLTNRAFLLKICLPYQDVDVIIQLFCLYILINDLIFRPSEVAKVLKSLNVNKVCGPDGVSPPLLKECYTELVPSLMRLFNYSLSRGTLPIDWKTATVVPIFKSEEQTAVDNYRPVSLSSVVVKSLELIIHNHIRSFLSYNKLLCDNQHGFRPLRS